MGQLMCPFTINLQYAFQDESRLYMVSEFYSGGSLAYYLYYKGKRFKEQQAKFVIANVLQALEFFHQNSIMHRDVQPTNLVFTQDGYLRLIDLSLARVW